MPRKTAEVEKSLEAKGFQRPRKHDHNYFHYYSRDGKKTAVFTKTSHGSREIDDTLLGCMAKQCKLSRADFDRLIECTLDRGAYEAKLVETGFLEVPRR